MADTNVTARRLEGWRLGPSWVLKSSSTLSAEMLVNLDISWVILSHSESNELCLSETRLRMHFAQGLKVITCVGQTLEQQEDIIGEAVFVGFNDEMTNLTNIRASECGPLLDGENPKDSQLPQFTHSRSKFLTTISVLNIKRLLSHTFWKRESLPIPDFVVMRETMVLEMICLCWW